MNTKICENLHDKVSVRMYIVDAGIRVEFRGYDPEDWCVKGGGFPRLAVSWPGAAVHFEAGIYRLVWCHAGTSTVCNRCLHKVLLVLPDSPILSKKDKFQNHFRVT